MSETSTSRTERLVSVARMAERLDVSPSTIRNWIKRGYLRYCLMPSGQYKIPSSEAARILAEK